MSLKHGFVSTKSDGADATKLRPSNWGSTSTDYNTNPTHVFDGAPLGSLLFSDTGASDGASWLAAVAVGAVLVSGGVGAAPAWSATPTLTSLTLSSFLFWSATPRTNAVGALSTLGDDTLPIFYIPSGGAHGDAWDNLFIGYRAGAAFLPNNTAYSNVAIGPQAGANLSGDGEAPNGNTFVGHGAGNQATTATSNTLIGDATGHEITTATQVTYVGFHTGVEATGGTNTIIGSVSFTGAANVGINNTSLGNNCMGASSLTGQNNVNVGADGMRGLKGGSRNAAFGWNTLDGVTSGNGNIGIGHETGNNITTGSNNIVIGNLLTVPSATGSSQLNIGDAITGNLSTGALSMLGALTFAGGLVSYGANDSAGAGFRLVRVPNA